MISLAIALSENAEVLPGPCAQPHRTNPGPDLFRFIMLVLQLIMLLVGRQDDISRGAWEESTLSAKHHYAFRYRLARCIPP